MKPTRDEIDYLDGVVNDRYGFKPFSGMITNLSVAHPEIPVDDLIWSAVRVALRVIKLSKGSEPLPKFAGVPKPKADVMKKQQEYNDKKMTEQ